MAEATHGHCPKCSCIQPVIWTNIRTVIIQGLDVESEFEGLEMKCRGCEFIITQIGQLRLPQKTT